MSEYKVGDDVTVVDNAWSRIFGRPGDRVRRYNNSGDIRMLEVLRAHLRSHRA